MEANKILLQKMYTKIIIDFSNKTGKSIEESMDCFYKSTTYELIREGVSDLHCRGYRYLSDELMIEYGLSKFKS